MAASTHTFTVVVECADGDAYIEAVNGLSSIGEIIDEQ